MPVAAVAIPAIASVAGAVIASRQQTGSNKRSIAAQDAAAKRAEAALLEDRTRDDERDAEDKRRWEVDQANQVRKQAQEDALLKDNLARANYEDAIRYGKMVNIARLTGQPMPTRPPARTAIDMLSGLNTPSPSRAPSDPLMSRQSTANAMIAAPGAFPMSPEQPQRMPISNLVGRRRVV